MKRIISAACFAGIGAVLASGGISWSDWQTLAVLSLAATSSITSELMP